MLGGYHYANYFANLICFGQKACIGIRPLTPEFWEVIIMQAYLADLRCFGQKACIGIMPLFDTPCFEIASQLAGD